MSDTLARARKHSSFLRRLLLTGAGNAIGRALGLVIATVLAGLFGPTQYGYIRWAMSAAMLAAIPASAGPVAIARALGAARGDPDRQSRLATVGIVSTTTVALVCAATVGPALAAFGHPVGGVIAVLVGMSVYAAWFGIFRGLGNARRMAALYVGSNSTQLLFVLILCGWLAVREPDVALLGYAFAWLPMILVSPRVLGWVRLTEVPGLLRELWRIWGAQVLVQAAYTAWTWGDVVVVDHFLGATAAGYYGLARTGATLFVLVPEAVAMLLLPQVAAEGRRAIRMTGYLLGITGVISTLLVIGVPLIVQPLLAGFSGGRYEPAMVVLPGLSVGMAFYTLYMVMEGYLIGRGRTGAPVLGMWVTALVTLLGEVILLPTQGLAGAGLAFAIGAASGLATIVLIGWKPWVKEEPRPVAVVAASVSADKSLAS